MTRPSSRGKLVRAFRLESVDKNPEFPFGLVQHKRTATLRATPPYLMMSITAVPAQRSGSVCLIGCGIGRLSRKGARYRICSAPNEAEDQPYSPSDSPLLSGSFSTRLLFQPNKCRVRSLIGVIESYKKRRNCEVGDPSQSDGDRASFSIAYLRAPRRYSGCMLRLMRAIYVRHSRLSVLRSTGAN